MTFSSSFGQDRAPGSGVTAVLGPTNTGKTHLAIERMLAHSSGVIGLPLRLLAREVYNKIAARAGPEAVALITGEEKIKPKNPRYWVSTVEAMPRDLDVSFLAVDEVQIASDLERGHVFTDRILNRRGRDETLLLGAATMRPIIERLLPGVSMITRPRLSQLAGRAGRATGNGTFGTTGRCGPFEPELVNALQNHTFDSVKVLQWRNSKLDFSSLGALQVSLNQSPGHEALTRAPIAEDMRVLDHAARDADVREMAHGAAAVERLWDACQIPDYRKIAPAAHAELVTTLFGFLMRKGSIPDGWFAAQVEQADRIDGDIDTLSSRIAQIRTWTFVANRPDWLADPDHWQGIARQVEK